VVCKEKKGRVCEIRGRKKTGRYVYSASASAT
jgi:hypothetical protein